MDKISELERLAALRDKGALTDEEFQREKVRLMGPPAASQSIATPKGGIRWGKIIGVFFALYVLSWPVATPSWVWLLPALVGVGVCGLILKRGVAGPWKTRAVVALLYFALFGALGLWSAVSQKIDESNAADELEARKKRGGELKEKFRAAIDAGDLAGAQKHFSALNTEFAGNPQLKELREDLKAARDQFAQKTDATIIAAVEAGDWDATSRACSAAKGLPASNVRHQHCQLAEAGTAVAAANWPAAWKACQGVAELPAAVHVCEQAGVGLLDLRQPLIEAAVEGETWAAGRVPCEELGELAEKRGPTKSACKKIIAEDDKQKAAEAREARTKEVEKLTADVLAVVNDKKACDTPNDVKRVWIAIRDVKKEDPGYSKARAAVSKLERCRKQMERTLGNALRDLMLAQREKHVSDLDRLFLDEGMDVRVQAVGKNKTTLKMTYALFSRAWAYKLTDGGSMSDPSMLFNAQKIGFKKVVFADGYRESFTYTLDPQDESRAGTMSLPFGLKEPLKL